MAFLITLLTGILAWYCCNLALFLLSIEGNPKREQQVRDFAPAQETPWSFIAVVAHFYLPVFFIHVLGVIFAPRP